VVVIDDASKAMATAYALMKGGVDVMEITMRTAAGMEAIRLVSEAYPDMLVGAGTVLTMEQCKNAIKNGAKFIVSPGFDPEIVDYCISEGILVCPGCVTPTEITAALKKGLKVLKFFPANIYGGLKAIKALVGPFVGLRFIPTGGVDLSNLADFNNSAIFAVGGGWLCSREDINKGNFDAITDVCGKSVDVLLGLKDEAFNSISLNSLMEKGGNVTTINMPRLTSQLTRRGFVVAETDGSVQFTKENVTVTAKTV
jgi:2-dehydro-3-deoxyphosphogluconate aldolase/(4S)-4-hydroxy-2-oxoglutarate aldolase